MDAAPSKGTFYVDKAPSKRRPWRVMVATYKDGKTLKETVSRLAYQELGFNEQMTIEQARARAKQINATEGIKRREARAVANIAKRVEEDQLSHSVFVPPELNQKFISWMDENIGNKKRNSYWVYVKKMVIGLQLQPNDYFDNKKKIYRYFQTQEISLDYTLKLLRILNAYGRFMSRFLGKYYEKVPNPHGHDREMINDAYLDSDGYVGASEPLTPELLGTLQAQLPPEQHSWLKVSVWLGLRPKEIEMILADRKSQHWRVESQDRDILWVYQSKLTSKPRHLRWKPIPILYSEQEEALEILFNGRAAKPLAKTLKKKTGINLGLYGGRKGFTDLMLDKGQSLEHIAQWMGHSSIEMTWTKYKDKRRVGFTLPVDLAGKTQETK